MLEQVKRLQMSKPIKMRSTPSPHLEYPIINEKKNTFESNRLFPTTDTEDIITSTLQNDSDLQKSKLKTKKKNSANKKFQRFFGSKLLGNSGHHEQVISIFSCALLRNHSHFLLQGSLYVTKRFYGFHSNIFGYRTVLLGKWSEVTSLKKENVALFFPTAISFTTKNNEKFMFASFLSRNYAFKYFCKLWHLQCPFYDPELSENGEASSFDSKEHQKNDENGDKKESNYENSTKKTAGLNTERFQCKKAYDTSSANRSDSSASRSDSYTSQSKTSISSNNKNEDMSKDEENNNSNKIDKMEPQSLPSSSIVKSLNLKKQHQITATTITAIPTKNIESVSITNKSSIIRSNALNEEQKLDNVLSTNSLQNIFVLFISKNFLVNFLVFCILFVILVTLYVYVFIIFFHVNQIEKKLSDLHDLLTE